MSFIFSRNSHHLKKYLVIGANIRLLGIYSNKILSDQHTVFPLNTYCEVTHRLPESIRHFASREPKISYQYSGPIQIFKEQKQGGKVSNQVTTLVLDLGSTGLNSTEDQITEIAIRDLKGGENSTYHMLVSPEKPLKNHKTNQILTGSSVPRYVYF
jgi:hypothetical protein